MGSGAAEHGPLVAAWGARDEVWGAFTVTTLDVVARAMAASGIPAVAYSGAWLVPRWCYIAISDTGPVVGYEGHYDILAHAVAALGPAGARGLWEVGGVPAFVAVYRNRGVACDAAG